MASFWGLMLFKLANQNTFLEFFKNYGWKGEWATPLWLWDVRHRTCEQADPLPCGGDEFERIELICKEEHILIILNYRVSFI